MGKRGLGRGLSALITEQGGEERQHQVREVPVEQVVPNPYQPRTLFDPLKMQDLVASVKEHGILQPVLLKELGHERFQLVAGERRFRAAQSAGLATVPALIRECSAREMLEMAVVENVQREDIGPMEAARAYRRLLDEFGLTQEMVAQRVGKTRTSITNLVGLLHLPDEVQDSVERGEITEGHARALRTVKEETSLLNLWRRVVKNEMSVRATEEMARASRGVEGTLAADITASSVASHDKVASSASAEVRVDPHETHSIALLQEALQTKVILRRAANGAGRIEIEFYSGEELERLVELLTAGRISR